MPRPPTHLTIAMRYSLLLAAFVGLFAASAAVAQVRFLPYVGYQTNAGYDFEEEDVEDAVTGGFLVGVGVEFGLTPGILPVNIALRPSVETLLLSGEDNVNGTGVDASQSSFRASLDAIANFSPPLSPVGVYAGVGVTYVSYNAEVAFAGLDEDVDGSAIGANLILGARFGSGFIQPFVQGRYSIADPTPDELQEDEQGTDELELGSSIAVQAGVSIGL